MAGPDMGMFNIINMILPFIPTIAISAAALLGFLWYRHKYQPEICRVLTKAYHTRAPLAFIQDEMGNVAPHICDKKFPEGVIHFKNKGWFFLPNPPEAPKLENEFMNDPTKKKLGRSLKNPEATKRNQEKLKEYEEKLEAAQKVLVQAPLLQGFGRQVFFGSSTSVALSGLNGIAHAHLPAVRNLAPRMYQKTQIDALYTGGVKEGEHSRGKSGMQLLIICAAGAILLGSLGLVVYLILQGGK